MCQGPPPPLSLSNLQSTQNIVLFRINFSAALHATNILTIFVVFCLNIWWAAFFFFWALQIIINHSPPKFKPAMVLNIALQTGVGNFLVVGWLRVLSGGTHPIFIGLRSWCTLVHMDG